MNPFDQESKENTGGLQLSPNSLQFLEASAKWARFLSILGFIGCGFMVLAAFIMFAAGAAIMGGGGMYGRGIGSGMGAFVGVFYLFGAVLYFFPFLYLNRFAGKMLTAVMNRDSFSLESSFENLRNHYRFVGILTIIVIALYALIFLIMMAAGAAGGFR